MPNKLYLTYELDCDIINWALLLKQIKLQSAYNLGVLPRTKYYTTVFLANHSHRFENM